MIYNFRKIALALLIYDFLSKTKIFNSYFFSLLVSCKKENLNSDGEWFYLMLTLNQGSLFAILL